VFIAARVNPHRCQYQVLAEMRPVDHQRHQNQSAQLAAHQFPKLALSALD